MKVNINVGHVKRVKSQKKIRKTNQPGEIIIKFEPRFKGGKYYEIPEIIPYREVQRIPSRQT